jgi:prepilin-type N-terminal cleavage/methylation domain-containing protein
MFDSISSSRGFTLIETIVVVTVFTILMIGLIGIYLNFGSYLATEQKTAEVVHSASRLTSQVHDMTLQANAVAASYVFSGTTYTSGSTTLVLELPSVNASGDIVTNAHDYVVFYATNTKAYKIVDSAIGSARVGATIRLSDTLGSLTFTYDNATPSLASKVDVDVQTQAQTKQGLVQTRVHEQAYLRNK